MSLMENEWECEEKMARWMWLLQGEKGKKYKPLEESSWIFKLEVTREVSCFLAILVRLSLIAVSGIRSSFFVSFNQKVKLKLSVAAADCMTVTMCFLLEFTRCPLLKLRSLQRTRLFLPPLSSLD